MKKMFTLVVVVLAISILGVSTYAQTQSTDNNQNSSQSSTVQSFFDQMYQSCTNIAGGFMKTFMNSYGKDRMQQMYDNYMNGSFGTGITPGNSSTTNGSSQSTPNGYGVGMMNGYGNVYNNNNNRTSTYGYGMMSGYGKGMMNY